MNKRFSLAEWFNDLGTIDGLLARPARDESYFPNRNCLNAYRRGYRLGLKVRTKNKTENRRE